MRGEPLYGDAVLLKTARGSDDAETVATFARAKRSKAMTPNCPATSLPAMTVAETKARIQQGLKFDAAQLAARLTPEQLAKDFATCSLPAPVAGTSATPADAKRLLACRFGLPFEKTRLSPLTTNEDPEFFSRLMKNRNLPKYLKALPSYYRQ